MSSLAASRADNFYFPPEWRPEYGGISKFAGSKGANQYQQYGIIRFEVPFDGWCLKCDRHIGKGTRFNAKKDKAGAYFSTTIFAFTMKCASCDNKIVIKTDPQNKTYDYAEGIRKMEQEFTPDFGDSIINAVTDEERDRLQSDPIYQLQHEKEDKEKALASKSHLSALMNLSQMTVRKDYDVNFMLRKKNRASRKRRRELEVEGTQKGLCIPLVEASAADREGASQAAFRRNTCRDSFAAKERSTYASIQSGSIFDIPSAKSRRLPSSGKGLTSKDTRKSNKSPAMVSSSARQKQREVVAVQKQAARCIDVRKLKIQPTTRNTEVAALLPQFSRAKFDQSIEGLSSDVIEKKIQPRVRCDALEILSGCYGDDD